MPQFHVYQSPDFLGSETVEENHWQTGNLVFELLKEFLRYRTSNSIPPEVRGRINVHDSQVIHETGMQREAVDNLQHCGKCLLHATCGVLLEHWSLVSLFESGDPISILTMPESKSCFCTFGVVFHGHSRVVRKSEFRAEKKFYTAAHVSGSGRVQALAKSVDWNTTPHWEGITRLLCYFRPHGEPTVKRAGGKKACSRIVG